MKRLLVIALLLFGLSFPSYARTVRVRGHTTKSGKYVAPHVRTSPNRTKRDNYSTKGNTNPYTGKKGSKKAE